MAEMIVSEISSLINQLEKLEEKLKVLLLPSDPLDARSILLEGKKETVRPLAFNKVLPHLLSPIEKGKVVNHYVQAPRTQTRSFCYVFDMVDGLIRLMEGDDTGPINIRNSGIDFFSSFGWPYGRALRV
ncbi:hypothetical protein Sjap_004049 [Stephania japonica]|uniref:NAD-dependent epimerase/dehydratase domain-containing protein n=1 Tax=Stephania japonica TaxID=461633 RepID=A0AAP0PKI8_9MAGN